ncbi:hypothetical protein BJP43_08975 [Candidatus Williamhamiltonella defendens]|uniref:Uncharacterized protein n=1 Tax=Candidatus Williamhamiltonella defendens TaxID=138072 RepID=A0A2D3TFB2_9ENTR|nr:hypothetical protein BJP43_08975 [Candidatus Hamiltonella defensa]AYB48609.1 hypothetical protein CJJ19_02915 [Candidatus Hamiltonella defensa]
MRLSDFFKIKCFDKILNEQGDGYWYDLQKTKAYRVALHRAPQSGVNRLASSAEGVVSRVFLFVWPENALIYRFREITAKLSLFGG